MAGDAPSGRPEERWAIACVREAFPHADVSLHDDNTATGIYDVLIGYQDGHRAALEASFALVDLTRSARM